MEKLRRKMKKQGGFTLVEMLIVVAIIAILIAVSIPLVSSALERAAKATDAANERSARAVATVSYLTDSFEWNDDTSYYYDIENGILIDPADADTNIYGKCNDHKGGNLTVTLNGDYEEGNPDEPLFTIRWTADGSTDLGTLDSSDLMTTAP